MSLITTNKIRLGAAFLMATSAIGPGFLTQTTVFTAQLGASFGFVILVSVLLDLAVQINIWRIITAAGQRAPVLANQMLPGIGHLLTLLIAFGGLAFNIGNVAGCGLGLEVLLGIPTVWGAALSGLLAAGLFLSREAGRAVDAFSRILGLLMIALMVWVAFSARPPVLPVLAHTIWPEKIDFKVILTIVGGTVGGYISFAGAHRLLESGWSGSEYVPAATRSALQGIGIATIMRVLLFLAAWGVVASGAVLDAANPPASMFGTAAGALGYRFFGLVMWSAAVTSVVGATFTSLSFLTASFPLLQRYRNAAMLLFIGFSVAVFVFWGKPVQLLVWAGTVNGFILPVALAVLLLVARRPERLNGYHLPLWGQIMGWMVVAIMGAMAVAG
jgi:Mn2+/Fe2+ NRAMP family transporter